MGAYVDSLKFAGGSFTLMPDRAVQDIIELCHGHEVLVSTGVSLSAFMSKAMMP
jgi:phosphosulfolactate synthase (CoM biosynthesis protein A)